MTLSTHIQQCPECLSQEGRIFWRDMPMNETLREYARTYISPPIEYYVTLDEALAAIGEDFNLEDYL